MFLIFLCKYVMIVSDVTFWNSVALVGMLTIERVITQGEIGDEEVVYTFTGSSGKHW